MTLDFPLVFRNEWLKRKRSFATWLVVGAALFTPAIILALRLLNPAKLPALYASETFWHSLWRSAWESMSLMLLPMAAILATSLVTQIEYRNNTWKQVHALPLHPAAIYGAKLAVILVLLAQILLLFNIALWLTAMIPALVVRGVPWPAGTLAPAFVFAENGRYFVDCLPIVALQYLVALRFRNFLVPLGVGFMAWICALGSLRWQFSYALPYTHTMLDYLQGEVPLQVHVPASGVQPIALGYFVVFAIVGYWLFVTQRQKG